MYQANYHHNLMHIKKIKFLPEIESKNCYNIINMNMNYQNSERWPSGLRRFPAFSYSIRPVPHFLQFCYFTVMLNRIDGINEFKYIEN